MIKTIFNIFPLKLLWHCKSHPAMYNLANNFSYSSRLPDECASIKRKCAGKTAVPKPARKSALAISKIGNEPTLEEISIPKQTLSPKRPISLPRSNTAPALLTKIYENVPEASREETQDTYSNAGNTTIEATKKISRAGLTNSKSFDKRIVEVNRASKTSANQKDPERKAKIDEQLKNAIKNISKPQRNAVIEEPVCRNTKAMKAGGGSMYLP